jgi:hypothetical protein
MTSLGSFLRAATVIATFAACAPASAAVIEDWGVLAPASIGSYGQTVTATNDTTTFAHDYLFQLSGDTRIRSVTLNFNAFAPRNIYGLQALLFKSEGGEDVILASTGVGSGSTYETIALAYSNLDTFTDYFIRIIGSVTQGTSGTYAGMYELSPVPLPAAVWLFGSAIFGLAAVGRKRRAAKTGSPLST